MEFFHGTYHGAKSVVPRNTTLFVTVSSRPIFLNAFTVGFNNKHTAKSATCCNISHIRSCVALLLQYIVKCERSYWVGLLPRRQPHRHSGLATLPSRSHPYYCRLGEFAVFCVYVCLLCFSVDCVIFVCLQYFDTVGWVF